MISFLRKLLLGKSQPNWVSLVAWLLATGAAIFLYVQQTKQESIVAINEWHGKMLEAIEQYEVGDEVSRSRLNMAVASYLDTRRNLSHAMGKTLSVDAPQELYKWLQSKILLSLADTNQIAFHCAVKLALDRQVQALTISAKAVESQITAIKKMPDMLSMGLQEVPNPAKFTLPVLGGQQKAFAETLVSNKQQRVIAEKKWQASLSNFANQAEIELSSISTAFDMTDSYRTAIDDTVKRLAPCQ